MRQNKLENPNLIPLNIAFTLIASKSWMGGFNYLLNLVKALVSQTSSPVCCFIFCGEDAYSSDVDAFNGVGATVVSHPIFNATNRSKGLKQASIWGIDVAARDCFLEHQINLVFESASFYGWRFPLPTIAWVPDLQHRLMPELFSRFAWLRRELGFLFQLKSKRTVLLSSEAARKDFDTFYPQYKTQTEIVHFPPRLSREELVENPYEVLDLYQLPKTFVFLPNQFWKHKNHAVVIDALALLKQRGIPITVVATGNTHDPRHPKHYIDLLGKIKKYQLDEGNFRILGMIPRQHLLALLQTCAFLLNPSKSEGWSSTVEEAKFLGVPMILSDLAVHQEQAGTKAHYFSPDDSFALANYLEQNPILMPKIPRSIVLNEHEVMSDFAHKFINIAQKTVVTFDIGRNRNFSQES